MSGVKGPASPFTEGNLRKHQTQFLHPQLPATTTTSSATREAIEYLRLQNTIEIASDCGTSDVSCSPPEDGENIHPNRPRYTAASRCSSVTSSVYARESKDVESMMALLESKARAKQKIKSSKSSSFTSPRKVVLDSKSGFVKQSAASIDALARALLQNKRFEAQLSSMKNEVRETTEQKEAMKAYINGLESALINLQRKFASESAKVLKMAIYDPFYPANIRE